ADMLAATPVRLQAMHHGAPAAAHGPAPDRLPAPRFSAAWPGAGRSGSSAAQVPDRQPTAPAGLKRCSRPVPAPRRLPRSVASPVQAEEELARAAPRGDDSNHRTPATG